MMATSPLSEPPVAEIQTLDKIAGTFQRASSELLRSRALLRRMDTKYVVPTRWLPELMREVRSDYALLESNGFVRPDYRTLYYDSPSLEFFHAHRRGQRPRCKLRVRHHMARERSFLEQKSKGPNNKTIKNRLKRKFGDNSITHADGIPLLSTPGQTPLLRPTAWTNFQRITLVGLDRVERGTVDLNLVLRIGDDVTSLPELAIVEIKQPRDDRSSPLRKALRRLGFRPFSVSKYCLAICLLRPEIRHNSFKSKLKHIGRLRA